MNFRAIRLLGYYCAGCSATPLSMEYDSSGQQHVVHKWSVGVSEVLRTRNKLGNIKKKLSTYIMFWVEKFST